MKPMQVIGEEEIVFTKEEQELISKTQDGNPIKMGIIPHAFPLSECPPERDDFIGTNVETLKLISKKTGLKFEYERVPLEEKTPREALLDHDFSFVAGVIRLDQFTQNPDLILSNYFDDGSLICLSKKGTDSNVFKKGKAGVSKGYQAGIVYTKKTFPNHEINFYDTNKDVVKALRNGEVDIAMIGRYVGTYELQSPFNEDIMIIEPYSISVDSCIMGVRNEESERMMSIINKGLANISDNEYSHVQRNFSIVHPYNLSISEFIYKNRYLLMIATLAIIIILIVSVRLLFSQRERKKLSRDPLTGAYSEAGFELAMSKAISKSNNNLFIVEFDLSNFSTYNELHGKEQGDNLLKSIYQTISNFLNEDDIICRAYADTFKVLSRKEKIEDLLTDIKKANVIFDTMVDKKMYFNFGIYPICDKNIPISKMLDFVSIVRKDVKSKPDQNIKVFDEALYEEHIQELNMMKTFDEAIENNEFIVYYQPKYDANTKALIGAEALVRWQKVDGELLMPGQFIELFEKNGLIQRLDFHVLEQVCIFLKKLGEDNINRVPISVNFSRIHLFTDDFVGKIKNVVERFDIPKQFIEIECTETAMMYDEELATDILGKLQEEGFDIAMDDFGKGYSSLNALSLMPLDIVKLDSGFFSMTLVNEDQKANKVIEGTISLVHNLSLKVVAEGVETKEQYLFLKSIGCDYIQGYYFSRPLTEKDFLIQLHSRICE